MAILLIRKIMYFHGIVQRHYNTRYFVISERYFYINERISQPVVITNFDMVLCRFETLHFCIIVTILE